MSIPPLDPRDPQAPSEAGSQAGPQAEAQQVLEHLDQVLSSATFAGAKNQQHLLRFLVEKLLQGDAAYLKEYSLGVEVFARGADFDPRLDPIVRVEASRLRSRLHKYYETEGQADALCIDLPRGGYVPAVLHATARDVGQSASALGTETPPQPAGLTAVQGSGSAKWVIPRLWALSLTAVAMCGAFLLWMGLRSSETAPYSSFTRLTRDQDRCTSPSLSPDGKRVAYARRQDAEWDIWVRDVGGVASRNITGGSHSDNVQPAYSPDGLRVAFRSSRDGGGVFLAKAADGRVRKLTDFGFHPAWSPNGKQIAISTETFKEPAEFSPSRRSRIFLVDVGSGVIRAITSPNLDAVQPAWSPNGRRIAFWGANSGGDVDIWTIAVDRPPAETRPLAVTHDHWTDWSPAWSPDGRYLYFSSDRAGTMNLWRVRIDQSGGEVLSPPEPLSTPSSNSGWIAFSRDGHRLAYARRLTYSKLYRQGFDPERAVLTGTAKELTSGERRIREPAISPDGAWVAARVQDPQSDLVLIRPDGSGMTRLTNDSFVDRIPRWSPDGRLIVFQSNRSGKFGLWAIRPNGTGLRPLLADTALHTVWTPDGSLVAYPRDGKPYVLEPAGRTVSAAALAAPDLLPLAWSGDGRYVTGWLASGPQGNEPLVVYSVSDRSYWHVTGHGNDPVWLKNGHGFLYGAWNAIQYADVRDNTTKLLLSSSAAELHPKFALSKDERFILYIAMEDEEDVWIAER
jgi:Tol biopolymer transport system component